MSNNAATDGQPAASAQAGPEGQGPPDVQSPTDLRTGEGGSEGQPARNTGAERRGSNSAQGTTPGQAAESGGVTRAAGILGALTFISRVSGLLRDIVVSAVFGTSMGADAFFVAFRIPNLFRRVVAEGASSAAFVPVFTDYRVQEGDAATVRTAAAVGGAALLVLLGLTAAGMIFADPIIGLFAPGFAASPEKRELTVLLTRLTFPYLLFVGAAAWAMGLLHTFRSFAIPAVGPVMLNVCIITAALTLTGVFELPAMALVTGVLVGGAVQFLVQGPSLWRLGIRPSGFLNLRHPAIRRVGGLLLTVVLGGAVYQINVLVGTAFASLLPDGSVSFLWYADRVFEFPLGIVAVAVGTAALPTLSGQAKAGRLDDMAETVHHSVALTWSLCAPAAVGIWILAPEIVGLLFERGAFRPEDTAMTAWALRAYTPGLLAVGALRVFVSAFYAMELPRVPVLAAAAALVANVVCDLAFMGPTDPAAPWAGAAVVAWLGDLLRPGDLNLRHAGLALATAIASIVNASLLVWYLRRMLPAFSPVRMLSGLARCLVAAAGMAVAVLAARAYLAPVLPLPAHAAAVLAGVSVGGVAYLLAARLCGVSELSEVTDSLLRRLRR